jgi:GNAT superfamily N-acetyltransferase
MAVVRHRIVPLAGGTSVPTGMRIVVCPDPVAHAGPIAALVAACREPTDNAGPVPRPEGIVGELAGRPGRGVTAWCAFTAEPAAACVGFVTLVETAAGWSVGWLLVHPGFRRRGLGRALVAVAATAAASRGADHLTADTRSDWSAAQGFWPAVAARAPDGARPPGESSRR